MAKHLLLFDVSGFIHRSFHANAAIYRSDGLPIWAILGSMGMIWSTLQRAQIDKADFGAAVFDSPKRGFRKALFPEYKSSRPAARRAELNVQIPYVKHAVEALGLTPVEADGFEADDVLGTYATRAAALGIRTTLVSGDKDLLQFVRDGVIEVIDPVPRDHKGKDGTIQTYRKRFLSADVKAKFGVPPDLVPDAQALSGDAVDDIPGIDGIGTKMAGQLIKKFGGLEPLLKAASQSGMAIGTPAIRKALRKGADDARLYKKLATMVTDVTGLPDVESLVLHKPDLDHMREMLKVLGEERRFPVMFGGNTEVTLRLPHVPAPLQWWHGVPKPEFPLNPNGFGKPDPKPLSEIPRDPQDGFFRTKLVKGGPPVVARIWRDAEVDFMTGKETGFDIVRCEVDGKARNPLREWLFLARVPISKSEFNYRSKTTAWAKQHAPNSAEAKNSKPINWNEEPL